MTKILVFGKTGQVATELDRLPNTTTLSRTDADFLNPSIFADVIGCLKPIAVINAAAYTLVDAAEDNPDVAFRVNAEAPAVLSKVCKSLNLPILHLSTDYVFSGDGNKFWTPEDEPNPKCVYGRSKLAGEEAVRMSGACHVILRTSWVFSSTGNNFLKSILRASNFHRPLRVVNDQIGGPTPSSAIARACTSIVRQLISEPSKSGVYHFSGTPETSWHEFACTIINEAGRNIEVWPISTSEHPASATRPLNSRLDCSSTKTVFSIQRPNWREFLPKIISELGKAD